jgi:Ca2+-binding RTX toxin-like protein
VTIARATSTFAGFEFLESRRMLAATGAATLDADGVLTVEGTRGSDAIAVNFYLGKGGQRTLDVRINGREIGIFRERHVGRLKVLGGQGDDSIQIGGYSSDGTTSAGVVVGGGSVTSTLTLTPAPTSLTPVTFLSVGPVTIPATVLAGDGADTVVSADGDDHIEGGDGNDVLAGNGGDDEVLGQDGDDSLFGGAGSDTLIGAAGRDDLNGDSGVLVFNTAANPSIKPVVIPTTPGAVTLFSSGFIGSGFNTVVRFVGPSADDSDVLIGGNGGDTFHKADKASEMRDFNAGVDKVV